MSPKNGFSLVETTIADVHSAMRSGAVTSTELVEQYRQRIERYDRNGPELNSVITVNEAATARAETLDRVLREEGLSGPLHGIPVLVKDQAMTADIETTFGSVAFDGYEPAEDATIVRRLREAGAIILAKTNMPDWAAGFHGCSSVAGQTKNPYALDRDPGGSSAGTAAGIAANLGTVGIGEDTGGSIRVPASCCNLFGLRVTTGVVSRAGLSPLVERQDTAGPMARTVEDLGRLLEALTGFDARDERTGAVRLVDETAPDFDESGLDGSRIGVLREAFGDVSDPVAGPVTAVVDDALTTLSDAGAQLIDPVTVPHLEDRLNSSYLHTITPKRNIDAFLSQLDSAPVGSFDELYEMGAYNETQGLLERIADAPANPEAKVEYWRALGTQERLRESILHLLAEQNLDAVVFPDVQDVPPRYADLDSGDVTREDYTVNTVISSQSSCPSISMPAGFTGEGLPVGVELLAEPFAESRLLELAYAYEQHAEPRRPPQSAPPLQGF